MNAEVIARLTKNCSENLKCVLYNKQYTDEVKEVEILKVIHLLDAIKDAALEELASFEAMEKAIMEMKGENK